MDSVTQALISDFAESSGLADISPDKQFEHFAAFSVVSSRYSEDFDTVDLVSGDGADLNVDAFAVKINGRIASDADYVDEILELNGHLEAEFIIIQGHLEQWRIRAEVAIWFPHWPRSPIIYGTRRPVLVCFRPSVGSLASCGDGCRPFQHHQTAHVIG